MVTRAIVLAVCLIGLQGTRVDAHPLHSSFTEVQRDQTGAISISVRLFADDFAAQLDSLGRYAPGLSRDTIASRYVARSLVIETRDGRSVALEWCGMRTAQNLVRVCVRSPGKVVGAIRFKNSLMFDRFRDQISIVRWTSTAGTKTIVLTDRAPAGVLQ